MLERVMLALAGAALTVTAADLLRDAFASDKKEDA